MRALKTWRATEAMFASEGVEVVEYRVCRSSHRVYTVEYRGYQMDIASAPVKMQNRAMENRRGQVTGFKRRVDLILAGEKTDLPLGAYKA